MLLKAHEIRVVYEVINSCYIDLSYGFWERIRNVFPSLGLPLSLNCQNIQINELLTTKIADSYPEGGTTTSF